MPAVIFFACLDLEQKSSFMDGHYQESNTGPGILDMPLSTFGPRLRVNVFDFGAAVPQRVSLGNPLTV